MSLIIDEDEIRRILATRQLSLPLYETVTKYYRKTISFYREEGEGTASSLKYNLDTKQIRIFVCNHAKYQCAGLVHELQHVKLAMMGFPIRVGWKAPMSSILQHDYFTEVFAMFDNQMQHQVFANDFASLGFHMDELLSDVGQIEDMDKERKLAKADLAHPILAPYARARWDQLCMSHLLHLRSGWANALDKAMGYGREMFPETMDADFQWIMEWFHRGDFRSAAQYSNAMNSLLGVIGIPDGIFAKVVPCAKDDEFELRPIPWT